MFSTGFDVLTTNISSLDPVLLPLSLSLYVVILFIHSHYVINAQHILLFFCVVAIMPIEPFHVTKFTSAVPVSVLLLESPNLESHTIAREEPLTQPTFPMQNSYKGKGNKKIEPHKICFDVYKRYCFHTVNECK